MVAMEELVSISNEHVIQLVYFLLFLAPRSGLSWKHHLDIGGIHTIYLFPFPDSRLLFRKRNLKDNIQGLSWYAYWQTNFKGGGAIL